MAEPSRLSPVQLEELDIFRQDSFYSLTLQHKAFILKELYSMYPDACRADLSDSPTALYEHPQESRCWLSRGQALVLQVRGQASTRTRLRRRHLRR